MPIGDVQGANGQNREQQAGAGCDGWHRLPNRLVAVESSKRYDRTKWSMIA
jgi:hypothetical protein